ncbi:MAG: hypothetical protein U0800_09795 [Isosphaeraceae bacterium]
MRSEPLPDYCCAILETTDGRLLMEWRGPDAARAPGKVTFLGAAENPGKIRPRPCNGNFGKRSDGSRNASNPQ